MITILVKNGEVKVQGTFNMGYMGVFKDDDIMIAAGEDWEYIKFYWDIVSDNLDVENCTDEDIAHFLTDYFNKFEEKIQKNIKQVNDNFLIYVYSDMQECGRAFWENEKITIKDKLPHNPDENVYQPYWREMNGILNEYYHTPNDGSLKKTDAEAAIRKNFPMLDLDALLASIEPDCLNLDDGCISFQCSDNFDGYGNKIISAAYDELDENLTFTDWHNY